MCVKVGQVKTARWGAGCEHAECPAGSGESTGTSAPRFLWAATARSSSTGATPPLQLRHHAQQQHMCYSCPPPYTHTPSLPQVMIPDVQKLINQSGYVSSDIFNTRVIKPPTSVVVFPLRNSEVRRGGLRGVSVCPFTCARA